MKKIAKKIKEYFSDRQFLISFGAGLLFLVIGLASNYYAGIYATKAASNSVTDIILSNTRVWNVDEIFIWGSVILIVFVFFLCFIRPKRIPFVICSFGLFYFTRAIFISMTHLGPFPGQVSLANDVFGRFFSGNDMFFSGHTGAPFLLALIFWNHKTLRYIFFAWSVLFGVVVLLGHLHYTIDVFSAFFITYGIFQIALKLFPQNYKIFCHGLAYWKKQL